MINHGEIILIVLALCAIQGAIIGWSQTFDYRQ